MSHSYFIRLRYNEDGSAKTRKKNVSRIDRSSNYARVSVSSTNLSWVSVSVTCLCILHIVSLYFPRVSDYRMSLFLSRVSVSSMCRCILHDVSLYFPRVSVSYSSSVCFFHVSVYLRTFYGTSNVV